MNKKRSFFIDLLLLIIITIPSFVSLLNNQYFSIHDNQHVVRLFLLDQGLRQGYLYPRWVDTLSFGFGDPLFNFYPPLVYYLGELFHLLGFSLIWSVKLVFISGFLLAALSAYLLVKEYLGRLAGLLGATIYTYFFYHAVNGYVRGALSEFFAMALVPLVFLFFARLSKKSNFKNSLWFGISLASVFLAHQLVALPMIFFLAFYLLYYLLTIEKDRLRFLRFLSFGSVIGLGISAFYWLPMFIEKNYTFIDKELGGYRLHYIFPYQFWYSPWGYGGSAAGETDGMSFQLGKIPILFLLITLCLFFIYWFKRRKIDQLIKDLVFFIFLLIFSLFMTTSYSSFIWDNLVLLWNMQFPWRFMVFTAVFISLVASYPVYFLSRLMFTDKRLKLAPVLFTALSIFLIVFKYQQYFRPQTYLAVSDKDLTTFEEIAWTQSKTVVHFIPAEAEAKKNEHGVYVLDIKKSQLPRRIYEIISGQARVEILENKYADKQFNINAETSTIFQLNTFSFPGWSAYLDGRRVKIMNENKFRLITIRIPAGQHKLRIVFEDTAVRMVANIISALSLVLIAALIFQFKKINR